MNIKIHKDLLKNECPHIVVGTPGRILALSREKDLSLKNVRHFILDECDKMLESLGMVSFKSFFLQSFSRFSTLDRVLSSFSIVFLLCLMCYCSPFYVSCAMF